MVWELLPVPFSGINSSMLCALHRQRELRCLTEKIIPEMMFGIGAERIHENRQSTCYSSVLGLVGPRYLAQEGQIPDMVCALFREWPAWCGSCCLCPFQG